MDGDEWKPGDGLSFDKVGTIDSIRELHGFDKSTSVVSVSRGIDEHQMAADLSIPLADVEGFCYLRMVKERERAKVAKQLGAYPLWKDVLSVVGDRYDVEKTIFLAVRLVGDGYYHVEDFVGAVNQISLPQILVGVKRGWIRCGKKLEFMSFRVGGSPNTHKFLETQIYDNHLMVVQGQSCVDGCYSTQVQGDTEVLASNGTVDLSRYRFLTGHVAYVPPGSVLEFVGMQTVTAPAKGLFLSVNGVARGRVMVQDGLLFVATAVDSDAEFLVERARHALGAIEYTAKRLRCGTRDIYLVSDDLVKSNSGWNSHHFDMFGLLGISDMPSLIYSEPVRVPNDIVVTFNSTAPLRSVQNEPEHVIVCVGEIDSGLDVIDTSYHHMGVDLHSFSEPMATVLLPGSSVNTGVRKYEVRHPTVLLLRGKLPLEVITHSRMVFRPLRCYKHCMWYDKIRYSLPIGWYRRFGTVWSTTNFPDSSDADGGGGINRWLYGSIGKYGLSTHTISI